MRALNSVLLPTLGRPTIPAHDVGENLCGMLVAAEISRGESNRSSYEKLATIVVVNDQAPGVSSRPSHHYVGILSRGDSHFRFDRKFKDRAPMPLLIGPPAHPARITDSMEVLHLPSVTKCSGRGGEFYQGGESFNVA